MFEEAAALFAALGDETRLRLLARLQQEGARSTVALTDGTGLTRQAVTKHLTALARVGLVVSEARGRERLWTASPERIAVALEHLAQIATRWDDALERLARQVEPS